MKRYFLILAVMAASVACGPSKHAIPVEMRQPSKSGSNLAGKIVSVVCLEGVNPAEDAFAEALADGFAYTLEQDYGTGDGSIPIYRMNRAEGANNASKENLISLLMDTGSDFVFLIDTVSFGTMTMSGPSHVSAPVSSDSLYMHTATLPFKIKMYSFDAMDKEEKVRSYSGSSTVKPDVYSNGAESSSVLIKRAYGNLPTKAWDAGVQLASSFVSEWKTEQYSVLYYDSARWYDALDKALQYDWKGAMDIWLELVNSIDILKRSCAEYNISIACFMLGDCSLALQWLDLSDKDNKLPVSDALRKRIEARL